MTQENLELSIQQGLAGPGKGTCLGIYLIQSIAKKNNNQI